jgi:hypothetical protein
MHVSDWWQSLMIPPRWNVAGWVLPPLSVWHVHALDTTQNQLIYGLEPSADDVAGLLLIAATRYDTRHNLVLGERAITRQSRRIMRQISRRGIAEIAPAFSDYAASCMIANDRWVSEKSKGKALAAPVCRHLVLCLCDNYGMTVNDAWDHPYADARAMYDVWREREGDDSLVSDQQKIMIEQATQAANAGATT